MQLQVSIAKRLVFSLLIFVIFIAGCDTEQMPRPVDMEPLSELDGNSNEWNPQKLPEGPLKVEVEPESADVAITALPEDDGVIRVNMKVNHFGFENGRPRSPNSQYLDITLTKPNFLGQRYHIMSPRKEATATLVRVSYKKSERKRSFQRVSALYRLPIAYSTYIPAGYDLTEAHFHDAIIPRDTHSGGITMVWAKGGKRIRMTFMPKRSKAGFGTRPTGTPSTVTIDKRLPGILYDYGEMKILITEAGYPWNINMEMSGLTQAETSRVLDGIRLID